MCGALLFSCTPFPAPSPVQQSRPGLSFEEERLQIAIQIHPEHWLGYFRLSKFYQQQQQWEKALESLLKAQKAAPNSIGILRELGSLYQVLKQDQKALEYYSQTLRQFPDHKIFYLDRGKLFLKLQKLNQAEADFKKAIENNSDIFEAYLLLAFLNIRQKKLKAALPFLLRAAEIQPDQAEVWHQISVLQEKLGKQALAIESMRKAVDLNADNYNYLQSYAALLEKNYSTAELKKVLRSMLHLFPENAWTHAHYGNLFFHLEQYSMAEQHLKDAIIYRHDYAWAFFRLGALHAEQQQWDQAVSAFEQGLRYESNNIWARKQLGTIYELKKKTEAAIEQYQWILDRGFKGRQDESVFQRLAQLYWSELRFKQAIDTLQEGRIYFPESLDILWKLARFYEIQHQRNFARNIYLKILQQAPQNSEALAHLGFLEQQLGNFKQSEVYYKDALRISPNSHQVHQQLIQLQLQSQETATAEPELRHYIQKNPEAEWGYAQLGLLKLLQKEADEGLRILQMGLSFNPQSPWLHEIMGLTHEKLEQWEPALSAFKIALQNAPDSSFLWSHQGFVLTHLSQLKQARASLLKALLLSDIQPWPWYQHLLLQDTAFQQNWFGAELRQIRPALQRILLSRNEEALATVATTILDAKTQAILTSVLQLMKGQRQAALKTINALKLQDLQPWEIFQVGYIYEINADYQQAENYYQMILQSIPHFPWIHARLGKVYEKQNRMSESIQSYAEFVRSFEAPLWGLSRLALHLGAVKRNQEAITLYQKILTINPQNAEGLNNLSWLYLTTGPRQTRKVEQALSYAQQAVALLSSEEHLDTLAEAYFQSGKLDLALKTIKEAILKTNFQSEQFQYLMRQYQRFRKGDLHSLPDAEVLNISQ